MNEFVWAGEERLSDIVSLWKQGFPADSEEDILTFWNALKGEARCLLFIAEGTPCSMAFVIPATMNGCAVWYVYAAATALAYRRQGRFASLLCELSRRAQSEKVGGLFLRPATPSLFGYYARLGFVPLFYVEESFCKVNDLFSDDAIVWEPVTQSYAVQRNGWLARLNVPAVKWSEKTTEYAVDLLENGGMLVSDKGLVMYRRLDERVEITELLCAPKDSLRVIESLSRYFACQKIRVYRPPSAEKTAQAYGMFCVIDGSSVAGDMWYMGFSLE